MKTNGPKRDYTVDMFKPGDAAGVTQLFRDVYGDGYPVKMVYDAEQLVSAFKNGDYIPVVARTPEGRIVGYTSLYRSAPHGGLYEVGLSLVLQEYRRTPIAGLMFRRCAKIAPTVPGLDALFCEAVCNHTFTQRAAVTFKHIETAIEIDLMPAGAYEAEQAASGRVSVLNMFRTFVRKPHVVHVPGVYEDYCRYVLAGFDDSRTVSVSADHLPSGVQTGLSSRVFDFAQLARVTVSGAGADFEEVFDAEEKRMRAAQCTLIQVWLKLSWPWIGVVADILRARGFFVGGILPRWFGEDGFLMQKALARPNWEGIDLYTDRAARLLDFIKNDWEKTQAADRP